MRGNWLYLLLLLISAVVVLLFVCPYLRDTQHTGVCVLLFVVLVIAFLYGRQHGPRKKARKKIPEP